MAWKHVQLITSCWSTNREQPGVQIVTDGPEGKALPAPPLERQGQLMYLALRLGSPIFQLGPTKKGGMGMDQEPETYGMWSTNDMFFVLARSRGRAWSLEIIRSVPSYLRSSCGNWAQKWCPAWSTSVLLRDRGDCCDWVHLNGCGSNWTCQKKNMMSLDTIVIFPGILRTHSDSFEPYQHILYASQSRTPFKTAWKVFTKHIQKPCATSSRREQVVACFSLILTR